MGPTMFTCCHPSTAKNRIRSKRVPGYRRPPPPAPARTASDGEIAKKESVRQRSLI
jgi:hypothetical protein